MGPDQATEVSVPLRPHPAAPTAAIPALTLALAFAGVAQAQVASRTATRGTAAQAQAVSRTAAPSGFSEARADPRTLSQEGLPRSGLTFSFDPVRVPPGGSDAGAGVTITIVFPDEPGELDIRPICHPIPPRVPWDPEDGTPPRQWICDDGSIRTFPPSICGPGGHWLFHPLYGAIPLLPGAPFRDELESDAPGVIPPQTPGAFPRGYLGSDLDALPVDPRSAFGSTLFGRAGYVWALSAIPRPPLPSLEGEPLPWVAWNYLVQRVVSSCPEGDAAECFRSGQMLDPNRCSFNAPHLCSNVGLSPLPCREVPLDLNLRVLTWWKSEGRVVLNGRYDPEGLDLRGGSFALAVGSFFQSIPLEDFRRLGRQRLWAGRGSALALVRLGDDGRIQIVAREIEIGADRGAEATLFLELGNGVGEARIRVP
jgi:hypothetical protein